MIIPLSKFNNFAVYSILSLLITSKYLIIFSFFKKSNSDFNVSKLSPKYKHKETRSHKSFILLWFLSLPIIEMIFFIESKGNVFKSPIFKIINNSLHYIYVIKSKINISRFKIRVAVFLFKVVIN